MSRRDGRGADKRVGMWKQLAEQSPYVLSAETLDEVYERGLQLACALGDADLAVLRFLAVSGSGIATWTVARGRELARFHHSQEIDCTNLVSVFTPEKSDAVILEDPQLRMLHGNLPEGCRSLVLSLKSGGEIIGALELISIVESTKLFSRLDILRACASLLAQCLTMHRDRANLEFSNQCYRNFISEVSEGVWRFESRRPLPLDVTPEVQAQSIFENFFLAECNHAMARMRGYEKVEQVVGQPLKSLIRPEDPGGRLIVDDFIRNGYRLSDRESTEVDGMGRTHYFVSSMVGTFSDQGLTGIWGIKADVTAAKDLENQLTISARQAADANQAKSAFLANISHEIRTPLGVILGFSDLALDATDLSHETRDYISAIRRNGQQVTEILGEILDLSKIEASRLELEEIRFPLLPMLNEVITFLGLHAREKGLDLSLEKLGTLPKVVRTDPTRLRQILTNLIGNAIKFTEAGHVTLSVRMSSPPKAGTPVQLVFTVTDTGIGIPPELKEKLFQPFTQLEISTSRRFGGTGLGLTLSKQLVHALGGNLSLQASEVGRGSTFSFSISAGPFEGDLVTDSSAADGPSVAEPLAKFEDEDVFQGKRVLVIEDSEDNQLLISRYLSAVGIQVDLANNGFEGLEMIGKVTFDLVVLDIQMPGMDGHQTARALRANGFAQPIVALTAHAFKEDRERAFCNGFNEYLTKPINRGVLLKTLGSRLGSPSLH